MPTHTSQLKTQSKILLTPIIQDLCSFLGPFSPYSLNKVRFLAKILRYDPRMVFNVKYTMKELYPKFINAVTTNMYILKNIRSDLLLNYMQKAQIGNRRPEINDELFDSYMKSEKEYVANKKIIKNMLNKCIPTYGFKSRKKDLLESLNTSQLKRVYQKVYGRNPSAKTKKAIIKLLRRNSPKYKMDSSDEEYIYSSEEDSDYLTSETDDEVYETTPTPMPVKTVTPVKTKKTGLTLKKIPHNYDDQLNDLYMYSLNADKTLKRPPYSREVIKVFLNDLKKIKNHHVIENAYEKFKRYIINWKTQGGYPEFPDIFIAEAVDEYNQKQKRSRDIINRNLRKYHKKRQQRKKLEEERLRPTSRADRARLFASRYGQ